MKEDEVRDIMECLPKGRTKFYYFKDRYALMLLTYLVGEGKGLGEIQRSRFDRLARKPIVQNVIKATGCGHLTAEKINSAWPDVYHCYRLTLGIWGSRDSWARFSNQTSRPGWNLVLQLNFNSRHNHAFYRLVKPRDLYPFQYYRHPVATDGQLTLAWARMDLDLEAGEALIEEIQTDWIRRAQASGKVLAAWENRKTHKSRYVPEYVKRLGCNATALTRYLEETLKPHIHIWDEAMLASAIWFLKEEIGIGKIYYHTFEYGCQWKRITGSKPPRSLYTKLPDRFCFRKTHQVPLFLKQKNNRKFNRLINSRQPQFYLLDLGSLAR